MYANALNADVIGLQEAAQRVFGPDYHVVLDGWRAADIAAGLTPRKRSSSSSSTQRFPSVPITAKRFGNVGPAVALHP